MYKQSEIKKAIDIVMSNSKEDEEFQRRFTRLVGNKFNSSYNEQDLLEVINLIGNSDEE